jgi:hypothetical protein
LSQKWTPTVNGPTDAPVDQGAATGASLTELAQKLLELRGHLEQVMTGLNDLREEREVGDASRPVRFVRRSGGSRIEGGLRCRACGRTPAADRTGWTLRLCGDDVLHTFCPDCDRRHGHADDREVAGRPDRPHTTER